MLWFFFSENGNSKANGLEDIKFVIIFVCVVLLFVGYRKRSTISCLILYPIRACAVLKMVACEKRIPRDDLCCKLSHKLEKGLQNYFNDKDNPQNFQSNEESMPWLVDIFLEGNLCLRDKLILSVYVAIKYRNNTSLTARQMAEVIKEKFVNGLEKHLFLEHLYYECIRDMLEAILLKTCEQCIEQGKKCDFSSLIMELPEDWKSEQRSQSTNDISKQNLDAFYESIISDTQEFYFGDNCIAPNTKYYKVSIDLDKIEKEDAATYRINIFADSLRIDKNKYKKLLTKLKKEMETYEGINHNNYDKKPNTSSNAIPKRTGKVEHGSIKGTKKENGDCYASEDIGNKGKGLYSLIDVIFQDRALFLDDKLSFSVTLAQMYDSDISNITSKIKEKLREEEECKMNKFINKWKNSVPECLFIKETHIALKKCLTQMVSEAFKHENSDSDWEKIQKKIHQDLWKLHSSICDRTQLLSELQKHLSNPLATSTEVNQFHEFILKVFFRSCTKTKWIVGPFYPPEP